MGVNGNFSWGAHLFHRIPSPPRKKVSIYLRSRNIFTRKQLYTSLSYRLTFCDQIYPVDEIYASFDEKEIYSFVFITTKKAFRLSYAKWLKNENFFKRI